MERSGVTLDELRGMVDMIKAAGIKSFITIADKLDDNLTSDNINSNGIVKNKNENNSEASSVK
jgi:hypothetical protein